MEPDEIIYRSLLEACGRVGDYSRAYVVLSDMARAGIEQDASLYRCLFQAFFHSNPEATTAAARGGGGHLSLAAAMGFGAHGNAPLAGVTAAAGGKHGPLPPIPPAGGSKRSLLPAPAGPMALAARKLSRVAEEAERSDSIMADIPLELLDDPTDGALSADDAKDVVSRLPALAAAEHNRDSARPAADSVDSQASGKAEKNEFDDEDEGNPNDKGARGRAETVPVQPVDLNSDLFSDAASGSVNTVNAAADFAHQLESPSLHSPLSAKLFGAGDASASSAADVFSVSLMTEETSIPIGTVTHRMSLLSGDAQDTDVSLPRQQRGNGRPFSERIENLPSIAKHSRPLRSSRSQSTASTTEVSDADAAAAATDKGSAAASASSHPAGLERKQGMPHLPTLAPKSKNKGTASPSPEEKPLKPAYGPSFGDRVAQALSAALGKSNVAPSALTPRKEPRKGSIAAISSFLETGSSKAGEEAGMGSLSRSPSKGPGSVGSVVSNSPGVPASSVSSISSIKGLFFGRNSSSASAPVSAAKAAKPTDDDSATEDPIGTTVTVSSRKERRLAPSLSQRVVIGGSGIIEAPPIEEYFSPKSPSSSEDAAGSISSALASTSVPASMIDLSRIPPDSPVVDLDSIRVPLPPPRGRPKAHTAGKASMTAMFSQTYTPPGIITFLATIVDVPRKDALVPGAVAAGTSTVGRHSGTVSAPVTPLSATGSGSNKPSKSVASSIAAAAATAAVSLTLRRETSTSGIAGTAAGSAHTTPGSHADTGGSHNPSPRENEAAPASKQNIYRVPFTDDSEPDAAHSLSATTGASVGCLSLAHRFPDLTINLLRETCPHCEKALTDAEIRASWSEDENDYTTECPSCGNHLLGAHPTERPSSLIVAGAKGKAASMPVSVSGRFVARFSVSSSGIKWKGSMTKGPGSSLFCEYLSPACLVKELQTAVLNEKFNAQLRVRAPTLYWNLLVWFTMFALPFEMLSFLASEESPEKEQAALQEAYDRLSTQYETRQAALKAGPYYGNSSLVSMSASSTPVSRL